MEDNIEVLKRKITQIANKFNLHEVDDALKNEIEKVLLVSKNTDNVNKLNDVENWFSELHYKWKKECEKRNLRYIKFNFVDRRFKYTNFYNLIRKLIDSDIPIELDGNNILNMPWQVHDIAIIDIQNSYYDIISDEESCWDEEFEKYYSPINNDNFWYNIDELIDLKGILDGVDDYFIKEIITKCYFDGMQEIPETNEDDAEYFLSRKSEQKLEMPLEIVLNETMHKLRGMVTSAKNQIGKIIIKTYTVNELMTILEIHESYTKEFGQWYFYLGIDLDDLQFIK